MDADFFKYGEKSIHFRKYPATCGRSNSIRKRYVWTQIFFEYGEITVFENTRLRVDEALNSFICTPAGNIYAGNITCIEIELPEYIGR